MQAKAMVKPDGVVFWSPPVKFRSSCKIDVTFFPFDDQVCHLKFGSWAYSGLQVDLVNKSTTVDLSNYIISGEWELKYVKVKPNVEFYQCCPNEPYPDIQFFIHIRRRILYYLFNIILPCVWLSILSLIGFWLPPDSGEKVTLGITVLLAFSVFMLLIAENIPATSERVLFLITIVIIKVELTNFKFEKVPLIGIYLTMTMGLTSISIILTVWVLHIHHSGHFAAVLPRNFYNFITRRIGFNIGMKQTVLRYEESMRRNKISTKIIDQSNYEAMLNIDEEKVTTINNNDRNKSQKDKKIKFNTISGIKNILINKNRNDNRSKHDFKFDIDNDDDNFKEKRVEITIETPDKKSFTPIPISIATETTNEPIWERNNNSKLYKKPSATFDYQLTNKKDSKTKVYIDSCDTNKCSCSRHKDEYVKVFKGFSKTMKTYLLYQKIQVRRIHLQNEWKIIAIIIDRCLFWLFTAVTLISTIILLVVIPWLKNNDYIGYTNEI
jgi:hypothetical protein